MAIRRMELLLDDEDFDAIQAEITRRQMLSRRIDPTGPTLVPEGTSNLAGAILAEVVRDLDEYRDLCNGEPPRPAGGDLT